MTLATRGSATVSVPVLSNTAVSASANASIYFPPLISTPRFMPSRIEARMASGVASLIAQE